MKAPLLLALLPALALAQARPPSSGSGGTACALASSASAFAASLRATTTTNLVPGFQCDGILDKCVKFGPGADTHCGTNVTGEVVCGRVAGTGVWRFYGTTHTATLNAQNLTVSVNATVSAAVLLGANALIQNATAAKPVLVDDADGLQVKCKATLPTCTSSVESSTVNICGTGGALTKKCDCMGDGTTYAWRNLYNLAAGAGTTTTCPAT